ncbi:tetratricopeptide repeat protein [Pedobacter arcticus]|uniref:tetratricopeptide repeat protein n=1 Tax=Pedobacter arcticus TaxID=752140 RepID=UPI0003046731|nr:hypothetical protein [Pedobacter arcticus]
MDKFSEKDVINYEDGEMEANDIPGFEEALSQRSELQASLKLYRDIKGTLKPSLSPEESDVAFKANLAQFTKEHFKKQKPSAKIIAFSKIWYAAAVLVIGLLVWAPWNKNLYNKYSDTEMISFAERGENDQTVQQKATDAFNSGDYEEAKVLLTSIITKEPNNDMFRYYLGIAQLKSAKASEIDSARSNLTTVAAKESLLKYDAMFFIALSYLKEKDTATCKTWLNRIPEDADVYDKAQALLKDL